MSTLLFECRWADCRKEFSDKDQYKAHIKAHVDAHEPTPIRDIPNFRRAGGFSTGSSAPQPGFDYLSNSDGSQPIKITSTPDDFGISQSHFSALGLGSQVTPPITPMMQSPSLSAQIRSIRSPARNPMRAQSPMYGLAAPFSENITPDTVYDLPRAETLPPTAEEEQLLNDMIKTPSPPPPSSLPPAPSLPNTTPAPAATPTRKPVKRKTSGVKFSEATPVHKKRKIIPKTPYPDSDDSGSDEDGEGSEDEAFTRATQIASGEIEDLSANPFVPQSQMPPQVWDDSQDRSDKPHVEEVGSSHDDEDELLTDEEESVRSQLGDNIEVEDISPEH